MVKKQKPGFDPRLKEAIEEWRAQGKDEFWIEGFTRGWMRAAAQDKKRRQEGK
jgi:hypothetical protein